MADDRNFRSAYYEKVGYKGVDEKKNLESLLQNNHRDDRMKLKLFCLKFSVPAIHRCTLWCLLTNISPTFIGNSKYVILQRETVCKDLKSALLVMRIIDEKTPKSQVFYAMWLLEKNLLFGTNLQNSDHPFLAISETLLKTFDKEYEVYWLSKKFYELSTETDLENLMKLTYKEIEIDDPKLFEHLEKHSILRNLPIKKWYQNCFAGLIMETSLVRIWDKLIGGSSPNILIYVLLKLLYFSQSKILASDSAAEVMDAIAKSKFHSDQEIADRLVNKAIELWQDKSKK